MPQKSDKNRVISTVAAQLHCDRFLGGQWLPVGSVSLNHPPSPPTAESDPPQRKPAKGAPQIADQTNTQLTAITEVIAHCKKCELSHTRLNVVPGEGDPNARIVFVGEAPGANEDQQGRPFVGRAGRLLTNIIEAMGLKRQQVFICNILKCRPPNNRDPQATEIAACNGYLHQQLQAINPEVIVALGAHAAKTLLDTKEAIGRLRGKFHSYQPGPTAQPIKLIATYHPAYLLRNYSQDNRAKVWQDMQTVLKELNLPVPQKIQE